jgi:hypothetical protein
MDTGTDVTVMEDMDAIVAAFNADDRCSVDGSKWSVS